MVVSREAKEEVPCDGLLTNAREYAPNGIFTTCPCALRTKTKATKLITLQYILYYISDSPNKICCVPLRSSCILALLNFNFSPAIITQGFIFFASAN